MSKEISKVNVLISVDDIEKANISGLQGLHYLDKTLPDTPKLLEERDQVQQMFALS